MSTYQIKYDGKNNLMTIGFGAAGSNDQIVKDADKALKELAPIGGRLLKISGPASLPVAMVIAHGVAHMFGAIAVYDPKLEKFVVSITHNPDYRIGDLIE